MNFNSGLAPKFRFWLRPRRLGLSSFGRFSVQAIESRMDELLRRQRTLERRLESKPSGGAGPLAVGPPFEVARPTGRSRSPFERCSTAAQGVKESLD